MVDETAVDPERQVHFPLGRVLLWVLVLGVIGGLIGYVLDEPSRLKAFADRLEK